MSKITEAEARRIFKVWLQEQAITLKGFIETYLDSTDDALKGTKNKTNTLRSFGGRGILGAIKVEPKSKGLEVEVNKPYAKIHEYGGVINQKVSKKQRKFFWAKHFATGQDRFKFMALAKRLKIKIKARPYINPALEEYSDNFDEFVDEFFEELEKAFNG